MKVNVDVRAGSRTESIEFLADNRLRVKVRSPPVDGRANERVIELLAEHFQVPKSKVQLLRGHTSKTKVFEIKQ